MLTKRGLFKAFLSVIFLGLANGHLTETPSNMAVVAGTWMSMECRTTNGSTVYRWTLTRPTSSRKDFIFTNYSGERRILANYSHGADVDEQGSGLLYLNSTQLDDAGFYSCYTIVDGKQIQYSAQLIVLESEPICETNYTEEANETLVDGDVVWMQCRVNFQGMWAPTVEWKQHTEEEDKQGWKEQQRVISSGVSTDTVANSSVTSTLIYVSGSSKAIHFSCILFFQSHDGSVRMTATNVPDYTYTWTSPRLVPHQIKTDEEVYLPPLLEEVKIISTATPKSSGSNDWYIISLISMIAVAVFVSLLIGLGVRRYVRLRRVRDLNMIYNASTSSTAPMQRLERPSPMDYDIIPTTQPNIYDRIDGLDADDDVSAQAMTSQDSCHAPLTECYSGLMAAKGSDACQYDTLDLYEKMDQFNHETEDTATGKPSECPSQKPEEERYTTPGSRSGVVKANPPTGSSDYLQMVGSVTGRKVDVKPLHADVISDSDEDNKNGCDDYLQPGPKAMDCPAYIQIV